MSFGMNKATTSFPFACLRLTTTTMIPTDETKEQEVPKISTIIEEQELDVAIQCLGLQDKISIRGSERGRG